MICSEWDMDDRQAGVKLARCKTCNQAIVSGPFCPECRALRRLDPSAIAEDFPEVYVKPSNRAELIRQASKMRSITPLEMSRKFKVDRKRACYELWWAALSGKIRLHDGRVFIAFKKEPGVYVIKELLEERAW